MTKKVIRAYAQRLQCEDKVIPHSAPTMGLSLGHYALLVSSSASMRKQAQPSAEMHTLNGGKSQDGLDIKHSYYNLSNLQHFI